MNQVMLSDLLKFYGATIVKKSDGSLSIHTSKRFSLTQCNENVSLKGISELHGSFDLSECVIVDTDDLESVYGVLNLMCSIYDKFPKLTKVTNKLIASGDSDTSYQNNRLRRFPRLKHTTNLMFNNNLFYPKSEDPMFLSGRKGEVRNDKYTLYSGVLYFNNMPMNANKKNTSKTNLVLNNLFYLAHMKRSVINKFKYVEDKPYKMLRHMQKLPF